MAGTLNAYIDETLSREGVGAGPLSGLGFAAKDLFDVEGTVAQCGNPDWGNSHEPAPKDAVAIKDLLKAGASLRGKTITDEFAFSIIGENYHHGTPVNPNAPGRVCGGSSSGSASAVAGNLVDFALGTDTGGSVRVPASFCGIFGLRPTHGRVSLDGVFPLAPSFDTAGWFSRDPHLMRRIGEVLLSAPSPDVKKPTRLLYSVDAWQEMGDAAQASLKTALAGLEAHFSDASPICLTGSRDETLSDWFDVFRLSQGAEIWQTLGPWIEETRPEIGPGIKERLEWCRTITRRQADEALDKRERITERILEITEGGKVIILPIAPGAALEAGKSAVASDSIRAQIIRLSGIAPLTRAPQISLPLAQDQGFPLALSIMGAPGSDEMLLHMAETACGVAVKGMAPLL